MQQHAASAPVQSAVPQQLPIIAAKKGGRLRSGDPGLGPPPLLMAAQGKRTLQALRVIEQASPQRCSSYLATSGPSPEPVTRQPAAESNAKQQTLRSRRHNINGGTCARGEKHRSGDPGLNFSSPKLPEMSTFTTYEMATAPQQAARQERTAGCLPLAEPDSLHECERHKCNNPCNYL